MRTKRNRPPKGAGSFRYPKLVQSSVTAWFSDPLVQARAVRAMTVVPGLLTGLDEVASTATEAVVLTLAAEDVVGATRTSMLSLPPWPFSVSYHSHHDLVVPGTAENEVRAVVARDAVVALAALQRVPDIEVGPDDVVGEGVPTALVNPTIESELPPDGPPPARLTVTPASYPWE